MDLADIGDRVVNSSYSVDASVMSVSDSLSFEGMAMVIILGLCFLALAANLEWFEKVFRRFKAVADAFFYMAVGAATVVVGFLVYGVGVEMRRAASTVPPVYYLYGVAGCAVCYLLGRVVVVVLCRIERNYEAHKEREKTAATL